MAQPGDATFVWAFATTRASPSNCTGLARQQKTDAREQQTHAEKPGTYTQRNAKKLKGTMRWQ